MIPDIDLACFQNQRLQKIFQEYHDRVTDSLNSYQAQHFVGPDLCPNCLQRISADNRSCHLSKEVLNLKAPITTAADNKVSDIFPKFRKKIR